MTSFISYISALTILTLIYFIYYNLSNLKTINNELKILQIFDPEPDTIFELFKNHQPIVFQRELFFWKQFKTFLGKPLTDIQNKINTNTDVNYSEFIRNNLESYNLPLSYDWNIDIRNIVLDDKSAIFFIKQNNYMQMFGCVTGEMRVIIAPADQEHIISPIVNLVSTIDATAILDKVPIEMNYIEIIVRKGNMIYIPWGWFYFIYKCNNSNDTNQECVIVDCLNKSILSLV
jgi:hypothetical protein